MGSLEGKVAIVTGSARGIGKAIAFALAGEGARVVCLDHPSMGDTLRETCREVVPELHSVVCDVTDLDWLRDEFSRLGPIDILVNNAGITRDATFRKMSRQQFDDVIKVNLCGPAYCAMAALPHLNEGGRIVNISSVVGQTGAWGQANYSAAKGGLIALTKTLALELAKQRVTVNAVAPGYVGTEMVKAMPEDRLAACLAQVPLRRLIEPREIAGVVAWLCSEGAAAITGQVIPVNAGFYR